MESRALWAVGLARQAGVSVESKTAAVEGSFATGTPVRITAVLRCRPLPSRRGSPFPKPCMSSHTKAFNWVTVAFPVCHSLDH